MELCSIIRKIFQHSAVVQLISNVINFSFNFLANLKLRQSISELDLEPFHPSSFH